MTSPTPSAQTPVVDAQQRPTPAWFRFFASLGSGASPQPAQTVTGGSPLIFTAPAPGALVISGGAITALSMTRAQTSLQLPTGGAILPLGKGDGVTITFTGAPTITFLPS